MNPLLPVKPRGHGPHLVMIKHSLSVDICKKPESRNKVVAGGSNVTGIGEVALVQIVAPCPVPGEALRAHPALVVRRLLNVVALNVFEAGSWHFLANIGYTVDSVTSISLNTTTCSHLLRLYSHT